MPHNKHNYDYLIVGSGFAGSITALCLHSAGFNVCLVEKGEHPRFAIGESSTPIADMILRDLSDKYDLPELKKLSRYGSWQTHYPDVKCGLKRGFSYYKHTHNTAFTSNTDHSHDLLVAASINDENSDTQWYRPDTDTLFIHMVEDAGIDYLDQTEIERVHKTEEGFWNIHADQHGNSYQLSAGFIIDATGSPDFSGRFFNTSSSSEGFNTQSRAIYSHFENVPEWQPYLKKHGFKTEDYPYNPDHSALHHLLNEGWLWMLRFNNDLLSAGLVLDDSLSTDTPADQEWHQKLANYPSLNQLFRQGKIADLPGSIIRTGRLQRRLDKLYGDGWAALHHTAGFVDPLHSTGIAHSLAGVEKLVSILTETHDQPTNRNSRLENYQKAFFKELDLIDLLVASCYKSRHDFELFTAFSMLYFICSINYEQKRLAGQTPDHFLSAGHPDLVHIVSLSYRDLQSLVISKYSSSDRTRLVEAIRNRIAPFNTVGLMDQSKKNMYEHTAAVI